MKKFKIRLKSIDDVKAFVHTVNLFPYDVDLICGRYIVDAKSIMGIFSLDLTQDLTVGIHASDGADLCVKLASFRVE